MIDAGDAAELADAKLVVRCLVAGGMPRTAHLLFGYVFRPAALDTAGLNQPDSPSTAERIVARHQAFAAAPGGQRSG